MLNVVNQLNIEAESIKDYLTVKIDQKIKKDDVIRINVMKAFTNHADLGAMLNVSHEAIHNLTSKEFQFTVKNINQLQPAELNPELFD